MRTFTPLVLLACLLGTIAHAQKHTPEEVRWVSTYQMLGIPDQKNPDKWYMLFRMNIWNVKPEIEIVGVWVELIDSQTGEVFARRKAGMFGEQAKDGRQLVVTSFQGFHEHVIASPIFQVREKTTGTVHYQSMVRPLTEKQKAGKDLEDIEVPEKMHDKKPPEPQHRDRDKPKRSQPSGQKAVA